MFVSFSKLFKLFILLKEIIMIIKTHIKLILNMYNLFSKFYCRERERERETTCVVLGLYFSRHMMNGWILEHQKKNTMESI